VTELDIIPITDDSEAMDAARKEAEAVEAQTKLFQGLKFFLGREVGTSLHLWSPGRLIGYLVLVPTAYSDQIISFMMFKSQRPEPNSLKPK